VPAGDLTLRGVQAWLDAYQAGEIAKNRRGQQLVTEYERCRDPSAALTSAGPVS
jgi:hypothetical protein